MVPIVFTAAVLSVTAAVPFALMVRLPVLALVTPPLNVSAVAPPRICRS